MVVARVVAGIAALALWAAVPAVAFIGVFVGADAADPADPATVGEAIGLGVGFALVEGVLIGGALALSVFAVAGRFVGWRWLVSVPVVCALVMGTLFAADAALS
ncbi:hypothetical protein OJ998_09195 [Solirubrobacter taibaiensis]|nr:hypothetical protein [Solirubrobacter taibaiensis]